MNRHPENYVDREDLRQACGRSILCGFEGTQVTPELRELLREVNPLGLVLFARNIESPEQVAELNRELKSLRPQEPLLIAVDQEGGRVQRVRHKATVWPPMRVLGDIDNTALTQRVGAAIGRELRAMNFDLDLAPVLDVNTNPKNPVIGDRAFGVTADLVTRHGVALIQGLHSVGVGACSKHFPGHGDTDQDSHHTLPYLEHELPHLREVDWPPFRAAIQAGVAAVMTAHVIVRELDDELPATLSAKVLGYLREELSFTGAILSDDLEMKAVADRYSIAQLTLLGLQAGIDVFLACHKPEVILELYRSMVQLGERQEIRPQRLVENAARAKALRRRFYRSAERYDASLVGCGEHQALVEELGVRRASRL